MLTLAYIALAGVGCLYVLVSLLLGQLFDVFSHDGDAGTATHGTEESYGIEQSGHASASAGDAAGASFHFPLFSPLALATLAGVVGGLGLITRHGLHFSERVSLALSLTLGFVLTYAVTYVTWRVVRAASGSSAIRAQDLLGAPAEILTPIPEHGTGEVAAEVRGQRYPAPAREVAGRAVARGTPVRVVRVSGATLIVTVEPQSPQKP